MATSLQKLIAALRGGGQQDPTKWMAPQDPSQGPQGPMPTAPGAPPVPQMGGIAGQGQNLLQAQNAYKQYVVDTASQGGQPVPFEQFFQGAR